MALPAKEINKGTSFKFCLGINYTCIWKYVELKNIQISENKKIGGTNVTIYTKKLDYIHSHIIKYDLSGSATI